MTVHAKIPPVRFAEGSDDIVEGLAVSFGGPFRGNSDLYKTRFDKADLHLDWFTERPVLYHHGQDPAIRSSVIGAVKTVDITDYDQDGRKGKWIRAQLDKRHEYFDAIRSLVRDGALGWSHGTLDYLAEYDPPARDGTRNVRSWPIVEFTLTPVEANPDAFAVAMRSADDAVLEILGTTDEELRAKMPAKRGIQTFADIAASAEMSEELPEAFDTLSSAIYGAIYATDASFNPETPEAKKAAIAASLEQFGAYVLSIMDAASAAGRSAPRPFRSGARNASTDQGHLDDAHAAAHDILTHTSAAGAACADCGSGNPASDGEADGADTEDDSNDDSDAGDAAAGRSADLGPVIFTVKGDAAAPVRAAWLSEAERIGKERAAELRKS
jgi:hypothetical protein